MSRIRVFIATSLDGFIAGPNDELDWLPGHGEGIEDTFTPFMTEIGAMLMGRRTFDVALGFGTWIYGDTPVLVATHRPLEPPNAAVRAVRGGIEELVAQVRAAAGERDIYLDGGALIRSAMDAGLVDELTLTLVPTILGAGIPLFAGTEHRHRLELLSSRSIGSGLVQLRYRRLAD